VTAGGACFTPYSSERGPSPRWPPCATVPTSALNTFGCTGLSAPASVSDAARNLRTRARHPCDRLGLPTDVRTHGGPWTHS